MFSAQEIYETHLLHFRCLCPRNPWHFRLDMLIPMSFSARLAFYLTETIAPHFSSATSLSPRWFTGSLAYLSKYLQAADVRTELNPISFFAWVEIEIFNTYVIKYIC